MKTTVHQGERHFRRSRLFLEAPSLRQAKAGRVERQPRIWTDALPLAARVPGDRTVRIHALYPPHVAAVGCHGEQLSTTHVRSPRPVGGYREQLSATNEGDPRAIGRPGRPTVVLLGSNPPKPRSIGVDYVDLRERIESLPGHPEGEPRAVRRPDEAPCLRGEVRELLPQASAVGVDEGQPIGVMPIDRTVFREVDERDPWTSR